MVVVAGVFVDVGVTTISAVRAGTPVLNIRIISYKVLIQSATFASCSTGTVGQRVLKFLITVSVTSNCAALRHAIDHF